MKFMVKGERNGNDFQAPVEARTEDEAVEKFKSQVTDSLSEFDYLKAERAE